MTNGREPDRPVGLFSGALAEQRWPVPLSVFMKSPARLFRTKSKVEAQ
jgi:hypothetical protein